MLIRSLMLFTLVLPSSTQGSAGPSDTTSSWSFSRATEGDWHAVNRGHALRARIGARGLELTTIGEPADWTLTLGTVAFGSDGDARPLREPLVAGGAARVELRRDDLVEWFANDARGVQQGWIVPAPPAGHLGSALRIELAIRGLMARVASDGASALLVDGDGAARLRYEGLRAWDAQGRALDARLLAIPEGIAVRIETVGAEYPILVDPFLGLPDWTAESDQADAQLGYSVAGSGDVNGDGFDDVVVGAFAFNGGHFYEGRAYLFLGSPLGPSLTPSWVDEPDQQGARFGSSVAAAGDVDGDGYDDMIIGAIEFSNGQQSEGAAFLYRGAPAGPSLLHDWSAECNGGGCRMGGSVAGAGDVNGDGFDDLLVGAHTFTNDFVFEGAAFLYLGSATGPSLAYDWMVEGNEPACSFGASVAGAGDLNGDGFDDVVVGAPDENNGQLDEGRAFVFLGSAAGLDPIADWIFESNLVEGGLGGSVDGAGDVNDDGYDDLIVGMRGFDSDEPVGEGAFLFLGSANGPSLVPDWVGAEPLASGYGHSVAGVGDVDGDGYDDVLIGTTSGRVFLYGGSPSGLSSDAFWTGEEPQPAALFGARVAGAGDVDGNGSPDLLVGAPAYDAGQSNEGRAYLYRGPLPDCNANGVPDGDDIANGTSPDCNSNELPDECEPDCNGNGAPDDCDTAAGTSPDCNANGTPDECEPDCNGSGVPDDCDASSGTSPDCNANLIPDECEPECNGNGVPDECDIGSGTSEDCNANGLPDECEQGGVAYCFGDGGGAACPCGNGGASGHGCANGSFAQGARLVAVGPPDISVGQSMLCVHESAPGQPGLLFQGDNRAAGGAGIPYGDGLRCTVTNVVRLQVRTADATGHAHSTVNLAFVGGVNAGDTRRYQWWYRDPGGSPCGAGFNLSNGYELTWQP